MGFSVAADRGVPVRSRSVSAEPRHAFHNVDWSRSLRSGSGAPPPSRPRPHSRGREPTGRPVTSPTRARGVTSPQRARGVTSPQRRKSAEVISPPPQQRRKSSENSPYTPIDAPRIRQPRDRSAPPMQSSSVDWSRSLRGSAPAPRPQARAHGRTQSSDDVLKSVTKPPTAQPTASRRASCEPPATARAPNQFAPIQYGNRHCVVSEGDRPRSQPSPFGVARRTGDLDLNGQIRSRIYSPAPTGGYSSPPPKPKDAAAAKPVCEFQSERERDREGWHSSEWLLLRFWRGKSTGHCVCGCARITVDEMLAKRGNYQWLEQKHHFMQWLFPKATNGVSGACAPTLTTRAAKALSLDPSCSARVMNAYRMILDFWGLELLDEETGAVQRAPHCAERFRNIVVHEHNYLRITRVLVSLGMGGRIQLLGPLVELLIEEVAPGGALEGALSRGALLRYWIPAVKGKCAGESWQKRLRQHARNLGIPELSPDEVPESPYFRPGTKAAMK
eukprot:Hpha_TRINITY_DN16635_c0_g1::TRINITY_DN16635_c0_g1_i1::g.180132::m.180132